MKERIQASVYSTIPWLIVWAICILLIRFYEAVSIAGRVTESFNPGSLTYDIVFILAGASTVLVISLVLGLLHRHALKIIPLLLVLVLLLYFSIVQYFVVTLLPLSADFYGYTLDDIKTTVASSGGGSWLTYVCLFVVIAIFIGGGVWLSKMKTVMPKSWPALFLVLLGFWLPKNPSPEKFDSTLAYFVTLNKPSYFISKSRQYLSELRENKETKLSGYPFLHTVKYPSGLVPYFKKADNYPNIVLVIVEGLGRDFTGPNAKYGGFTPFLDSLAQQSLTWNNMLSNAGRTFGALPSLLGSLPYGRNGFMSYGTDMPRHQTMIGLLKEYGYTTNFFYGGNPNFDNQDIFLEYNGIDHMVSQSNFPNQYQKMQGGEGGSWGYADKDVFTFAHSLLSEQNSAPRLDVYLTLTTHEPFISPETTYDTLFDKTLAALPVSDEAKEPYETNRGIFSCLQYTDDALKQLLKSYKQRPDYKNTIFIVTGDHRLIPMPSDNRLSRFHVPFIIHSPLLTQKQVFNSTSVHAGVEPSLLGLLHHQYGLTFPATATFICDSLTVESAFTQPLSIALIRNKNEIEDFIDGEYFLSGERLYKVSPDLDLIAESNESKKKELYEKLKLFKSYNAYACENDRVDSVSGKFNFLFPLTKKETDFLEVLPYKQLNPEQQFLKAREFAFAKQYKESRSCLKFLLNKSPNFHDARVLLARTYAWNNQYDSARLFLEQTLKRAPNYADAMVAMADLAYWDGLSKESEEWIANGLQQHPENFDLQARKARILFFKNKRTEARKMVEQILTNDPANEIALDLKTKLAN